MDLREQAVHPKSIQAAVTRIPQIRWLINNRHSFLTVLEGGKSKIKVLAHLVSGESCRWLLLDMFSHGREGGGDFFSSYYKAKVLFYQGPINIISFNIDYLLKILSPDTVTWGLRLQYVNLEGTIQSMTVGYMQH